ncbi:MAG: M28 family peptidase [Porphyromonas sp.]|nr:M28 family peptidase [Porphyromonas sp.]
MRKILSLALIGTALLACNLSGGKTNKQPDVQAPEASVQMSPAPFDADSAYAYIQRQVDFGVRTPGSPGHRACGDWLVATLKGWGYSVTEQSFPGKDYYGKALEGRNIIASLNPTSAKRMLLMAHWDTRVVADADPDPSRQKQPIEGADDGGSGVGVLLELARQWSLSAPNVGIDIVLFDQEDGGSSGDNDSWCLGSQYWAAKPHVPDYRAEGGILLDMVGAKDARFHWESYSRSHAAPLLMELWDLAKSLGHIQYFPLSEGGGITDDHIPVIDKLGIPCVDIVNFSYDDGRQGFGEHWHTHTDNMSIIDKATLRAVGQTVATYISKQQ